MLVAVTLFGVALLLATACFAALAGARPWASAAVYGICALMSAIGLVCAGFGIGAPPSVISLPLGLPTIGMHFRIDALAAVFLAVVDLGGLVASLFAIGYGRRERDPQKVLPFYPAFLAGMNLVVIADDAFAFLLSWEFMSLMSWALVVSHGRIHENLRAGLVYILMASLGTLLLLPAFALLAGSAGQFAFSAMRAHGPNSTVALAVLSLALIGAGSKAGIFPLHAWLPLAHPAAPSHVSALMSGIMTKVAVYVFIRIAFDLVGPVDWRFGMAVIAVGGITALLGVLYALMQHDLKRLLAYHTVENIGIIFVGLGLALVFRADGMLAAAALAASAALFHVFNHSLFKSLLFFAAGAVQNATNTRDMDKLGGLIRVMPKTAIAFLIGAAAISALPPLNGFASEWMVFQAIFLSSNLPQWGLRLLTPSCGAVLALSAALAAACFVKAFGATFLGRPRSDEAKTAKETDKTSILAMYILVAICVFAGIAPFVFIALLAPAVNLLTAGAMQVHPLIPWQPLVPVAGSHNSYSGLVILVCLIAAIAATALFVHLFANRITRRSDIWDCGHPEDNPLTQYTAASLAQPIRRVFASVLFHARETVDMPAPGDTRAAHFCVTMRDPAWDKFYVPPAKLVGYLADRINPLQYLTIRRYLGIVFLTLVLLLMVLAIWE